MLNLMGEINIKNGMEVMNQNIYGPLGTNHETNYENSEKIKSAIARGAFEGLSTKTALLKLQQLPLETAVDLAISVRDERRQAGHRKNICASGYLPHNDGSGCEMSCSFCGFPENFFTGDGPFVSTLSEKAIIEDAANKRKQGATRYKIVSLGCSITEEEYQIAVNAMPELYYIGFEKICVSFGVMSEDRIRDLVTRFGTDKIEINHNLEVGSSETYVKLIGSHKQLWQARYNTILTARQFGIDVCAGGLLGIGETLSDQADLVIALRELNVTSTPLNVFVMDNNDKSVIAEKIRRGIIQRPSEEDLIRILCMWRLGLPRSSIAVNSGFGRTGNGDFGIYSGLIELGLINDKVSLPNQGKISSRFY